MARSLALSTVVVAACSSSGGPLPSGPVALDVRVDGTHTHVGDGTTMAATWSLVGTLTFGDAAAEGWLAIDGLTTAGGVPVDQPTTSSVAVTGMYEGNRLTLSPFTIYLPDAEGSVDFSTFSMTPDGTAFVGSVTGTFHARDFDDIEDWSLSGKLTAEPDQTAPRVVAVNQGLMPVGLEPVELAFTEPVDLGQTTIAGTVASGPAAPMLTFVPITDPASGLATRVEVTPVGYWPSNVALTMTLSAVVDHAANAGDAAVTIAMPPRPDPSTNLGFEAGMAGWLTRGVELAIPVQDEMVFVSSTTQQLVVPPAGAAMCEIPTGAEITGFLTPPSGATTLSLELALIDESPIQQLQQAHSGVYVDITTLSGSVTVADGGSVATPADTTALWTGFQPLTVTLPADASGGFWLTIRTSDYEPPIHTPEVLVDGIHF